MSTPLPGVQAVRRQQLTGDAATDWFAEEGWAVDARQGLRVFVDELRAPTMTMRRVWHTPVELIRRTAPTGNPVRASVIIQVLADLHLTFSDTATRALTVDGTLFARSSCIREMRSSAPTARIEVASSREAPVWWGPGLAAPTAHRLHADGTNMAARTAAISLVNSALNAPPGSDTSGAPMLLMALDSILTALEIETRGSQEFEAEMDGPSSLYGQALQIIHDEAIDPVFSVEVLAQRLGITRRYLARIFESRGTTPSRTLRRKRLSVARILIDNGMVSELSQVALRSGFPSARSLRAAMVADPDDEA